MTPRPGGGPWGPPEGQLAVWTVVGAFVAAWLIVGALSFVQ